MFADPSKMYQPFNPSAPAHWYKGPVAFLSSAPVRGVGVGPGVLVARVTARATGRLQQGLLLTVGGGEHR